MADPAAFIGQKSPLLARRGAVASSQTLASEAGLRILHKRGSAADAVVAMAAALNVTEPCSTGLGGDAFVLWYDAERRMVESIQGNGRSPAALSLELVKERGHKDLLPPFDALTVTVPGAAAAWVDTIEKYGCLSLAEVLEPAIQLAEEGWPVAPRTANQWAQGVQQLEMGGQHSHDLLFEGKRAPRAGEVMHNQSLASTLRKLAASGKQGFYKGPVAEAIVDVLQSKGGVMTLDDLSSHKSSFEAPISSTYRGVHVWEVPPPTQGIAALLALNILEAYEKGAKLARGGVEHQHGAIEAMRIAFADTLTHVADPHHQDIPTEELLSKHYAAQQACRIDPQKTIKVTAGEMRGGSDTVYFCAVDSKGNGCSMINSNYMGFGTGIVPRGCGFSLQNRGHNFSLDLLHPNCLAPQKRPYHTIIPGLSTWPSEDSRQAGALHCVFGVMGGFMQPQGHLQVLSNLLDFGLDPQAALDVPRFCITGLPCFKLGHGPHPVEVSKVAIEDGSGQAELAEALRKMGHSVELVSGPDRSLFGRGQIIMRHRETGVLWAGSEGRADGCAMGY